jgi:hypothetical protein
VTLNTLYCKRASHGDQQPVANLPAKVMDILDIVGKKKQISLSPCSALAINPRLA